MLPRVCRNGFAHHGVRQQRGFGLASLLQVVAGESGSELEHGALGRPAQALAGEQQHEAAPDQHAESGEGQGADGHQVAGSCPSAFIR